MENIQIAAVNIVHNGGCTVKYHGRPHTESEFLVNARVFCMNFRLTQLLEILDNDYLVDSLSNLASNFGFVLLVTVVGVGAFCDSAKSRRMHQA